MLAAYAAWASSFGVPEDGAEAADRLARLDPSYPAWAAGGMAYAYLMVGRFDDALQALSRVPDMVRSRDHLVGEAVALAALGRESDAESAVAGALTRYPDISAEALVSRPMFAEDDRERVVEVLTSVGFPTCAQLPDLSAIPPSRRLPQCEAERAEMTAEKS